jgi:murein DD-endopeptidase MepM/ murein hydrolase activator NlpD
MKKLLIIFSITCSIGSVWYIRSLPPPTSLPAPVQVVTDHKVRPVRTSDVRNTENATSSSVKDIRVGTTNSSHTISVLPATIIPGVPVMVTIATSTDARSISIPVPHQLTYDGKPAPLFIFDGAVRAFIPIDFNETKSQHEIAVVYDDGSLSTTSLTVTPHVKKVEPLGIPEKLGGNTPVAQKKLVDNLAIENATLNALKTATTTLWAEPFRGPLATLIITDPYGYNRQTGNYTIAHKGTDFRAEVGTEVHAMNSGIVRIAQLYTIYGNTVAIDHGLGVQTLYMHMSELKVKPGDTVKAGQVIGLSGKTGYADHPHVHVSIKIAGISIDPMVFLSFFGV